MDGIADVKAPLAASYVEQRASQTLNMHFISGENIRQVFCLSNVKISTKFVPIDHKL